MPSEITRETEWDSLVSAKKLVAAAISGAHIYERIAIIIFAASACGY